MNYNWSNVYKTFQQEQQFQTMNFIPINNMPSLTLNKTNFNNMNNPFDQILMMSKLYQNQNISQMNIGGNNNFNNMNNLNSNFNNNNYNLINSKKSSINKINICFSTITGARINMVCDINETVDGVLTKFLKRVNLDHMIGNVEGKLIFIFSAQNLMFGDHRKINNLALIPSNFLTIYVHDTKNLIGAYIIEK